MIFTNKIMNFIAFQVSWLVCCMYASSQPWVGVIFVAGWTLCLLVNNESWRIDLKLMLAAAMIGYVLDSTLVLLGIISFPPAASIGWPTTWWMVALWVNLAATLRYSLSWLLGHRHIAAILGSLAGPLAYYAGYKLDAISISAQPYALAIIGLEWLLAMPLLLWLAAWLTMHQSRAAEAVLSR